MTPKPYLNGKAAIVTGAGRGIGRAIARRLGLAGANVVIASRTIEELAETRTMIERDGGNALIVQADVSQAADVEKLVSETQRAFGRIDVLVNNAGVAPLATIDQMEPDVFDKIIASNVRNVYLCSRGVWPIMSSSGEGVIVNISSVSAYDAFPGFAAYGASKAFVVAYTKFLAREGRQSGIRVYGIAPGAVDTDMLRGAMPDFPPEKLLEPDNIAAMVDVLLSPAYRYSSGQTVTVNKC